MAEGEGTGNTVTGRCGKEAAGVPEPMVDSGSSIPRETACIRGDRVPPVRQRSSEDAGRRRGVEHAVRWSLGRRGITAGGNCRQVGCDSRRGCRAVVRVRIVSRKIRLRTGPASPTEESRQIRMIR